MLPTARDALVTNLDMILYFDKASERLGFLCVKLR